MHAARPLPALPPGILEVRLSDLAPQRQPSSAGGLRKRADQVGLACGERPLQLYVLAAPDEPVGCEFGLRHPVKAAALEEVARTVWHAII